MFRNKVLVRATASTSSSAPLPPFLLRQLSLPAVVPIPALDLEILCSRLSRRYRLACLPQAPADALLVYQRCQSHEAAAAVSEVMAAFPGASVGEVEELACSGELVAKAVGCELRSLMLEHGWRCLGETIFVCSTFAESEERTDLCAVNVNVRLGGNDDFEFVVSPDAFRFAAHKISGAASCYMMETFHPKKDVVFDNCSFRTGCTILPTLQEGHVIGYSKILPSEQCLDKFMELCSLKHGLDTSYNYYVAVKLSYGTSLEPQWLPSSLVLQGSGLQPALKSVRASKAMSSLGSFAKLLNAWNFFGQNQLEIKEQLLLNCTTTQPTWDKTQHILMQRTANINSSKDPSFVATDPSFALDFRTPKPATFSLLSVKSLDTKDHKIDHCAASPIKYGCQSRWPALINLGEYLEPFSSIPYSYAAQVTLFKPSFSRKKTAGKRKLRYSLEHADVDNSNKSSHLDAATSLSSPVSSSSASLSMQVTQVSENQEREHAKLLNTSCQGGGGTATARVLQGYLDKGNMDTRRKIKVKKAISDIENDVLSTKVINKNSKVVVTKNEVTAEAKTKVKEDNGKKELTSVTKQKIISNVSKYEVSGKVRDDQNDELNRKVRKAKTGPVNKDLCNSTRANAEAGIANDEFMAKVIDHHRRGELHVLTVADLKCFLGARKAKPNMSECRLSLDD
ncbi:hypothetical protein QOZ80_8AG0628150 [Eleusine coracana subsp. coracana]|nr:hypothetical protein QOZ80_8AG0628150 [Eleusine coracana subsp. coracana]